MKSKLLILIITLFSIQVYSSKVEGTLIDGIDFLGDGFVGVRMNGEGNGWRSVLNSDQISAGGFVININTNEGARQFSICMAYYNKKIPVTIEGNGQVYQCVWEFVKYIKHGDLYN